MWQLVIRVVLGLGYYIINIINAQNSLPELILWAPRFFLTKVDYYSLYIPVPRILRHSHTDVT